MFEATLKNRISAHFAPVTITFPIPEDQYEQAILALEKSQIGDARVQDCLVVDVCAPNCPALNRMTGTMANVDELDWLGKQLESFDRYELLQFNAAVERFGLSAADELIDLSFCAREVTVVSDFTDLEKTGKRHFIVIVAEGIGHSQEIANEIQARTGIDTRATILGHVQRGGSPTLRDRVNASAMGYHAVCLLEEGKYNRIDGMKGEHLVDYPVDEALEMTKTLDPVLIDVCNTISI